MKFLRNGEVESDGKILRITPVLWMAGGDKVELPAAHYQVQNRFVGWRDNEPAFSAFLAHAQSTMVGYGPLASKITFIVQVLEDLENCGPFQIGWIDGDPVVVPSQGSK